MPNLEVKGLALICNSALSRKMLETFDVLMTHLHTEKVSLNESDGSGLEADCSVI